MSQIDEDLAGVMAAEVATGVHSTERDACTHTQVHSTHTGTDVHTHKGHTSSPRRFSSLGCHFKCGCYYIMRLQMPYYLISFSLCMYNVVHNPYCLWMHISCSIEHTFRSSSPLFFTTVLYIVCVYIQVSCLCIVALC